MNHRDRAYEHPFNLSIRQTCQNPNASVELREVRFLLEDLTVWGAFPHQPAEKER
jgi:hypothetical protein